MKPCLPAYPQINCNKGYIPFFTYSGDPETTPARGRKSAALCILTFTY